MIKKFQSISYLFYFIFSLIYMEIMLNTISSGKVFSVGLFISIVFSIPFAIIFYILCSISEGKISLMLSSALLGLTAFIFSTQLIYYKFFRNYYSLYSAGKGSQVLEFWKDILNVTIKNLSWITLFFLPVLLILAFKNKIIPFSKIDKKQKRFLFSFIILTHIIGIVTVHSSDKGEYSPYDLYFNSSYPTLSVERLGLLTTMRIDLQRIIIGWSPTLEKVEVNLPSDYLEESISKKHYKEIYSKNTDDSEFSRKKDKDDEKEIEYNIMDIDFTNLILNEKDETIKEMHEYFQNVNPTSKNEFTGKYEGYNLIFITAEGFSPYAVNENITPTLYKMVHEGYNFTNFYNPLWGVSTSDGEYVACTSLIPKSGVWSFYKSSKNNLPFVMGNQLKALGYKTMAYHNHSYDYYRRDLSHPNMGYEYKGIGNGLKVKKTWPESDLEMMEKTLDEYINDEPFHAYYMTVSGHMQYNFMGNFIAKKNRDYVKDLSYSDQAKAYIATQIELDRALKLLLDKLEEANILDKTLIALSADHYPYGLENETIDELAGHIVEKNFELYKSPFILYTSNMKSITVDKPCSSLDIIPTLSNLLGLEYDSRLLMGRDIFSDSKPLVTFLNKSFITDKGRYNSNTRKFIPNEGENVDEDYIKSISAIINNKFYYSSKILETNYYNKILYKK